MSGGYHSASEGPSTAAGSSTVRRIRSARPEEWWYLSAGGMEKGPYGVGEIRSMLNDGTITQHTWVWGGAMGKWGRVLDVPPQLLTAAPGEEGEALQHCGSGPGVSGARSLPHPAEGGPSRPPPMALSAVQRDGLAAELAECKAALAKAHELLQEKDGKLKRYKSKLRQASEELRAKDGELAIMRRMLTQARGAASGGAAGGVATAPYFAAPAPVQQTPLAPPVMAEPQQQEAQTEWPPPRPATGGLSPAEIAQIKSLLSAVVI